MNKFFNALGILAVIALFATACGAQVVQAQPEERAAPKAVTYDAVLGKSVNAHDVADFIDIPAWVIILRVFLDYEFESYYSMIIPGTMLVSLSLPYCSQHTS